MSSLRKMNAQVNVRSGSGYVKPYIWSFGSRRAVSERLYMSIQSAVYIQEYLSVFGDYRLEPDAQEFLTFAQTFLYGVMGMAATGITAIGAFATGQFWYGLIASAALPLQIVSLVENLSHQIDRAAIRRGYEKRLEIISNGFH